MFGDIEYALRKNLRDDREYAEEYAKSFLNAHVATQIKVIREQRGMTQSELGSLTGTTQAGISRYEDVNYSSWSLRTLMKLARAFGVRLRVSFDSYGTLPDEVVRFDRERLQVASRENDPRLFADDKAEPPRDFTSVTDIGAYKALAGIGQPDDTQAGGREYGADRSSESASIGNDGTGRAIQPRQSSTGGLYSTIGEAI
ncbi:MAG: helix-turn-helix transcriptional regulator [Terracidiphilus sp.]